MLQCHSRREASQNRRTKRFGSEPTLFRSDDVDLRCPVTQSPTGSKQSGSWYPKPVAAKVRTKRPRSPLINEMEKDLVDLAQALRERLAVIRDEQSRRDEANHIARLRTVSEKIDRLQATLPQPVDPRLAHYLQRKSYDKALEFLDGQITVNTARR